MTAPNVAVANARYFEGRYLAGIAAGHVTQTNVAGYVAGFPISEVLQGINAFALGMRSVTHQWGRCYTQRAQAVLDGSLKSSRVWGGVREGMIKIEGFGVKVPQAVRAEVLARQKDVAAAKLHPFHAGVAVLDNESNEVIAKGQTLSDEQILKRNWLVQGVQGKLP